MEKTSPFAGPLPTGGHILNQPFTLANLSLPVNGTLTCNCAVPFSDLPFVSSAPVKCPACEKTYIVAFNPQNGQLTVAMLAADDSKVAS